MNPLRVSVVLPVYNAEDTLDEAVKSLLDQTERNFQLIIVDDGSPPHRVSSKSGPCKMTELFQFLMNMRDLSSH